jgi:hypothetical protein
VRFQRALLTSGAQQGDVYLKIIEAVVEASTNDFEESGVGQATLQELQQVSDSNQVYGMSRRTSAAPFPCITSISFTSFPIPHKE